MLLSARLAADASVAEKATETQVPYQLYQGACALNAQAKPDTHIQAI